jgi:hypothetical protein
MMTFEQFFEAATRHAHYDYQRRLAGGDAGRTCESQLINVPTSLGKTAAVVLAWLWNRLAPTLNPQPSTLNYQPSVSSPPGLLPAHANAGHRWFMPPEEAQPASGVPPKLSPEEEKLVANLVADGLSIQDKFRSQALYKQTGKGHYLSYTVEEIRKAKEESKRKRKT